MPVMTFGQTGGSALLARLPHGAVRGEKTGGYNRLAGK
jgi:hypothetical protein